jgi:AraC-like DNA-binding protein
VDARALFSEAGLDYAKLGDPEARFPQEKVTKLWALGVEQTGDPCFGLRCAQFWHPSSMHGLGFAWLASATLKEGLERFVRYGRVMNDALSLELVDDGAAYRFVLGQQVIGSPPAAAAIAGSLAVIVHMCRVSCGPQFAPRQLRVNHGKPPCHGQWSAYFSCPIVYDCAETALVLHRESLERALPTGNKALAYATEQVIEAYLDKLDRDRIETQVSMAIVERLPAGYVSEEVVADVLHVSKRTLQRRLAQAGTTFQKLLDETRRQLATRYLERSDRSIIEVTYLLGFSEPSNFTRAFKRWYGVSPRTFRHTR